MVAVDAEASIALWRYRDDDELSSPRPDSYEGLAVVGDAKGSVHSLDFLDGSVVWTVEVRGTVRGSGPSRGPCTSGPWMASSIGFRHPARSTVPLFEMHFASSDSQRLEPYSSAPCSLFGFPGVHRLSPIP